MKTAIYCILIIASNTGIADPNGGAYLKLINVLERELHIPNTCCSVEVLVEENLPAPLPAVLPSNMSSACDQCHRLKLRCSNDGLLCEPCCQAGKACTYSTGKPIGKPKGSKNKNTLASQTGLKCKSPNHRCSDEHGINTLLQALRVTLLR